MRHPLSYVAVKRLFCGLLTIFFLSGVVFSSAPAAPTGQETPAKQGQLAWHDDYARAMDLAERQGKMLFILFTSADNSATDLDNDSDDDRDSAHRLAIATPEMQEKLKNFVRLALPVDAKITMGGKKVTLLELPAYSEMLARQGMAVVDFASKNSRYHGSIVSMFPLYRGQAFSAQQIGVMLDLPPGTLTQRTLIYAVRTHPERPASSDGNIRTDLTSEAESHSDYQARIRLQGHHSWETRFHRIRSRLPGGLTATEVCAESWPGENLLAAAIECVRCWRKSSGHWSAVRDNHPCYGYDMKRGNNGIWYATGIFGKRR